MRYVQQSVFVLLFLSFQSNLYAQINLTISYQTDKVETVEVWIIDNFIVNSSSLTFVAEREKGISQTTRLETDEKGVIVLKTGTLQRSFYIQPGFAYETIIHDKEISLKTEDPTDRLIKEVDDLVMEYKKENTSIKGRKKSYVPKMEELIGRLETINEENEYFREMLKYTIAYIKFDIAFFSNRDYPLLDRIEQEYLANAEVQYRNKKYFDFIKYFYGLKYDFLVNVHVPIDTVDRYKTYFRELELLNNDPLEQIAALYCLRYGRSYIWQGYNEIEVKNELLDSLKRNAPNYILTESIDFTRKKLNTLKVGDKVKEFKYIDLSKEEVSLSQFEGKWLLLDFWFVGCTPCHEALPGIKQFQAKNKGCLEVVSINPIDNQERVSRYVKKYDIDWNNFSSTHDSSIKSYFNIYGYPTYFLIDPNGEFRLIPKEFDFKKIMKEAQELLDAECKG